MHPTPAGSPPVAPEPPLVDGYRLGAPLGVGASSAVWAGVAPDGARVAVKVPHVDADAVALAQLELERDVLTGARHDHLVTLRDVATTADGRTALVSDLVEGPTLAATVRGRGHLRPGETVTVVMPVCEAVAALHAAGTTHGDVSGGNVVLRADGRPMLVDLGSARLAGHAAAVCGTPGFIAPEVRAGEAPGTASDVFALGALVWLCRSGATPPDADSRLDPDLVLEKVGPELADAVSACLDPDPSRRPSAAGLARLLYDSATPEPVEVVVGADVASAITHRLRAEAAAAPAPVSPRVRRLRLPSLAGLPRPRRRHVTTAAGAVLALGLVGALVSWAASPPAEPGRPVAAGSAGSVAAQGPSPSTGPAQVVSAADAARARPRDLLQALCDRRAAALVSRDVTALDAVHAAGSASRRADAEMVKALVDADVRWQGVRLEVSSASTLRSSSTSATIRARVDWTSYTQLGPGDRREQRPAAAGKVYDFGLVRGSAGWRISTISEPPAT